MVGLMYSMGEAGGSSLPHTPPQWGIAKHIEGKGKREELPNVMPHCLVPTVLLVGV